MRDDEVSLTGRVRPNEGETNRPKPRSKRPEPGQIPEREEKENTMFARNAARTFALALGLVALLASAASASAAEEPAAPTKKAVVNVNQASADELARLPRVGPSLAGKIVAHREQHGPFKRAQDLMEVKGIGEKMFAILQPYLAVSGPTTLAEKVSSKGTTARKAAKPAKAKPAAAEKAGR
jgi:competence protein ComEA